MTKRIVVGCFALPLLAMQLLSQFPQQEEPKRMPDGRLQSEVILKADHEKNLEELERMAELLKQVEDSLEARPALKSDSENVKRLEEVEKLAKRVRNRMLRF